jgi:nucleotide-binding universal stress UspA family protein
MRILFAVDGSTYTRRMLAYVAAHDEWIAKDHEYIALTVVAHVPEYASRFVDRSVLDGYYREEAEKILRPVTAFAEQNGWTLRTAWLAGHPAETIAAYVAQEKPDLIVMGTHGHSSLGNLLLGSVTTGVLARTHVPVLLVR